LNANRPATAVIVAAGTGTRMNAPLPKQFLFLNDKPILFHTLKPFLAATLIDEIIIVVHPDWLNRPEVKNCLPIKFDKSIRVVPGGEKRQNSVYNGISAISESAKIVVVHDGVRPFVTPEEIDETIRMCKSYDGAILAIPAVDTLKEVGNATIVRTIDRSNIWQAQTPQTFRKSILLRAFETAFSDGFIGTDEASLVERIGGKIAVLNGRPENIKITCQYDLNIAKSTLDGRSV
jgi:2-C-methyl-D-erythritol 4-phosphate cytidylyltransferase